MDAKSPEMSGITAISGLLVGHSTDLAAATGCTVVLCPAGAVASVDVRGGAPATRETDVLRPGNLVDRVHGVLLSGGSAFGLDAAAGVMRWLEEHGHGFPVRSGVVPIVAAAALFDLALGDDTLRGPVNAVAPETTTGRVFARTVGRVLRRPAVLPVPVVALRVVMGEMGRYVVASQRVVSQVATQRGYAFVFGRLGPALEDLLG